MHVATPQAPRRETELAGTEKSTVRLKVTHLQISLLDGAQR